MTSSRSSAIVMPAAAMSHLPVAMACPVSIVSNGVLTMVCSRSVLGHQVHQVDVEADDLAALVELERLVRPVGADGQLPVLHDLDAGLGGHLLLVGRARRGSGQGRRR
jgi:hypothetical protein